jgi:hypothetical protein
MPIRALYTCASIQDLEYMAFTTWNDMEGNNEEEGRDLTVAAKANDRMDQ